MYYSFMITNTQNKKEARAEMTRKNILVAASTLFARRGYHKTTITDIAQAIGLTSGAIFHHFPSKDALLEAVVVWLARGITTYSDYLKRTHTGGLSVLEGVVAIMCDHFHRQPEATICLAALATEFAGSNHPMEATLKQVYGDFVGTFARVLESHPRVSDPRAAAIAFVGAVQGIAIQGLLRENEHSIDQLANAFLTMFADW
jgi:AcrR family transcriptional regulator